MFCWNALLLGMYECGHCAYVDAQSNCKKHISILHIKDST